MERLRQRLKDSTQGDGGGEDDGKGGGKGGGKGRLKGGGKGDKGGGKGKWKHNRDRPGTEICFGGTCGQDPAPASCPASQAHRCEQCLSSDHRGADCLQRCEEVGTAGGETAGELPGPPPTESLALVSPGRPIVFQDRVMVFLHSFAGRRRPASIGDILRVKAAARGIRVEPRESGSST